MMRRKMAEGASLFGSTLVVLFTLASCAAPRAVSQHVPEMVCDCGPPYKTYLVFFDLDQAKLRPRAKEIIDDAASDWHSFHGTAVYVSGYTDSAGTASHDLKLSAQCAQAVAAQLVADGVPASVITTRAYGETHQLVPTLPGVALPQNRRVEIVLPMM